MGGGAVVTPPDFDVLGMRKEDGGDLAVGPPAGATPSPTAAAETGAGRSPETPASGTAQPSDAVGDSQASSLCVTHCLFLAVFGPSAADTSVHFFSPLAKRLVNLAQQKYTYF